MIIWYSRQKTQLENSLENLEEAKQECMRLSTENGKVSMLIYLSEAKKAFNLI
jgi:hypothetical protein